MSEIDSRPVIGQRIRALRNAMGYGNDQSGFARRLGISPSALANYEAGTRRPTIDQFARIRFATGATYGWMWHGERDWMPYHLVLELEKDDP